MRRTVQAVGAGVAILGLFAVPGLLARNAVSGSPVAESYRIAFTFLRRGIPGLELDTAHPSDRTRVYTAGVATPYRCLPLLAGGQGFMCVALAPDGNGTTAVWRASDPDDQPARKDFLLVDRDEATPPNLPR